MSRTKLASLTLALIGLLLEAAGAETRTAADLTPEAVWAAIDAAKDGDTVLLPAGTAVWSKKTWKTGHSAKVKAITIQGAGIDKTILTIDKGEAGSTSFHLAGEEGKPFRVTGITLDGSLYLDESSWGALMDVSGTCKNFRIDHCKFKNSDCMLSINGRGKDDTYGLVDHCYFEGLQPHGSNVQPVVYAGPGAPNYRKPLTLGTEQAMYFEDNEVYIAPFAKRVDGVTGNTGNNPWIAPNGACRIVIRHNKLVNARLEIYRPGRGGLYGSQSAEVYDNDCYSEAAGRTGYFATFGAGVAIVFNNTVRGTTSNYKPPVISLRNERTLGDLPNFPKADGKQPMDGNRIPAGEPGAGYPSFGQIGWATNVDGKFTLTPCYAWNNTLNGEPARMDLDPRSRANPNEAAMMKEGREFFNEKPPEGYYKPYVYPHPLQEGWEALMKSAATPAAGSGSSATTLPAGKP
jgi:hypothetical protein